MLVEHRCGDGTPFPVQFESAADAAASWALDVEHSPRRFTPMAEALLRLGDVGGRRAYGEVGMERPASFRPGPRANGFVYWRSSSDNESTASLFAGCVALVQKHGSALGVWRDYCLPLVEADCERARSAPLDLPLAEHAALDGHALQVTMLPAYICGNDLSLLGEVVADHVEGDARVAAAEMVQGQPTPTLAAGCALWALGRTVGADPALASALAATDPRTATAQRRESGSHDEFFAALDAFLAEYGERAEGWEIGFPIWAEQGPGFWSLLQALARPDAPNPAVIVERARERAAALVAEVEEALAHDPDAQARFRRRLERARPYVTIREERAHWQLVSIGCLRAAVLRRGQAMADAGVIDEAADVLFLVPEEVDGFDPARDLRAVVAQRRAEHERWLQLTPPPTVGAGGEGAEGGTAAAERPVSQPAPTVLVSGTPASKGRATGPVRVVVDLADAAGFQPGDILVCAMTSPPWTPLFGLAAALVTDGGDTGSHSAIAAREYGIPCVVGTTCATATLTDGQVVTVDGTTGAITEP